MAKHGPNRLRSYIETHETVMAQMRRGGFVLSDNLVFSVARNTILIVGEITCRGSIGVDVKKRLAVLDGEGANAPVQTVYYKYNVALGGHGTIFRYDSPHRTHRRFHHVHRYDVLSGDTEGSIERVPEDARGSLGCRRDGGAGARRDQAHEQGPGFPGGLRGVSENNACPGHESGAFDWAPPRTVEGEAGGSAPIYQAGAGREGKPRCLEGDISWGRPVFIEAIRRPQMAACVSGSDRAQDHRAFLSRQGSRLAGPPPRRGAPCAFRRNKGTNRKDPGALYA